jgi:hypothetical protein
MVDPEKLTLGVNNPHSEKIMSNLNYARFVRVLTRCVEIAAEQDLPPIINLIYQASAKPQVEAFLTAASNVDKATTAFSKENREGLEALRQLDTPYRVARSAVLAVVETARLPDTLKGQPTDTDKLNAIEKLLDILADHAGEPWADALLQGEFSTKGAVAVKELNESIAANKALNKAQMARAQAYGPAYQSYISFKHVVRDALGSGSKQYRRVHLRASPAAASEDSAPVNPGAPDGDGAIVATPPVGANDSVA